jgi:hypothetical protein
LCLCFLFFIEIYQFFCGGLLFQEWFFSPIGVFIFFLCYVIQWLYIIIHFSFIYGFQLIVFHVIYFGLFFQLYCSSLGLVWERYFLYKLI